MNTSEWSKAFQKAIDSKNAAQIKVLIGLLPVFETEEEIRRVLLQTIDAEATILEMRECLSEERKRLSSLYK